MIAILKNRIVKKVNNQTNTQDKMKNEGAKIKYINLDYLNTHLKSDPIMLMEMISLYLEITPPLIEKIKKSYTNKDWPSLQASSHKIIPSFVIMGMNTKYENMAIKIHEYAINQEQYEDIHGLILSIENVCALACSELEEELRLIKKSVL